jgi:hypothetical protein
VQQETVAQPDGTNGHLEHVSRLLLHRLDTIGKISRDVAKRMVRQHDPGPLVCGKAAAIGAPFDIHVLGTQPDDLGDDPQPLRFTALELAAFPRGATRRDDRPGAPGQRTGHVEIGHAVQAQLHHVGRPHPIARGAQLGHRTAPDGLNDKRRHLVHFEVVKKKASPAPRLKRPRLPSDQST